MGADDENLAQDVDRTGSIGLEAAAGPAHNVTRANDFMDLSPPLRNFFSPKENGAASGAIRESESSLFNRLRRQIGSPLADSPSGRTCVARRTRANRKTPSRLLARPAMRELFFYITEIVTSPFLSVKNLFAKPP